MYPKTQQTTDAHSCDHPTGGRAGSEWLTRREAATYAQVNEATISRAVAAGAIAHVRVANGRHLRFRKEWIDAWLTRGFRAAA